MNMFQCLIDYVTDKFGCQIYIHSALFKSRYGKQILNQIDKPKRIIINIFVDLLFRDIVNIVAV